MNSIQSLQSFSAQRLAQQSSSSGITRPEGLPPGLEKRIDSVLSTQDLTDEQRTSLKGDLETAIQSAFDSGSFPPDPAQVDSAAKEVFEKYGLDGDKLAAELRPQRPPGGHRGPPPGGGAGSCGGAESGYESNSSTKLVDLLEAFLKNYTESSSSTSDGTTDATTGTNAADGTSPSSTTSTHELAQSLAEYLSTISFGFDSQA